MDLTDFREKARMKPRRLELSAQEVDEKHEFSRLIAGKFMSELQEAIMVPSIGTFGMAELPTHGVRIRLQVKVGTSMGLLGRRWWILTKVRRRWRTIRRVRRAGASRAKRARGKSSHLPTSRTRRGGIDMRIGTMITVSLRFVHGMLHVVVGIWQGNLAMIRDRLVD
jgi:hypothetical protein